MLSSLDTNKHFHITKEKCWAIVFAVFIVAFSFALYTNHAWEDWFITYRAAKNLATGNGLVFTVGERVHSFTSPLGVLVPAFLSFITANVSDDLVLWLFRIIGCSLLAFTSLMLLRIAQTTGMLPTSAAILIGFFAVDVKIIDFSINGQEAAFMVVFLAAMIYVLLLPSQHIVLRLGLSCAGLMWARPDGFVYVGGITLGFLLFKPKSPHFDSRKQLARIFIQASMVATLAYLPWLLWAWFYYGTPVPHTVTAKGLFLPPLSMDLIRQFLLFLFNSLFGDSSVSDTFLPSYYLSGGWPSGLIYASRFIGGVCAYYWCFPFARPIGRAVSFTLFIAHAYLSIYAGEAPWYLPSVCFLTIFVLAQIADQITMAMGLLVNLQDRRIGRVLRVLPLAIFVGIFIVNLSVTLASAYQLKIQQEVVEEGNRREIGLWLKEQASSSEDTVFLECLGYIGFYSQLKMLDWPGMSSPEVVAARRLLNSDDFAALISLLKPDWLVLRPKEIDWVEHQSPVLLLNQYKKMKIFDVSEKINSYQCLPGRGYLLNDQTFVVYRRNQELR